MKLVIPELQPEIVSYTLLSNQSTKIIGLKMNRLGPSLRYYLDKNQTGFNLYCIQCIVSDLIIILRRLHSISMIHADIKPDNVCFISSINYIYFIKGCSNRYYYNPGLKEYLVLPEGNNVALVDYNSACESAGKDCKPQGTYVYSSVEYIMKYTLNYKTDIWSLGVSLYELYTGVKLIPYKDDFMYFYILEQKLGKIPNNLKHAYFYDYLEHNYKLIENRIGKNYNLITKIFSYYQLKSDKIDDEIKSEMHQYGLNDKDIQIIYKYSYKIFIKKDNELILNYNYCNYDTLRNMRHYSFNYPQGTLKEIILRKGNKYPADAHLLYQLIINCLDYDQNKRASLDDIANSRFITEDLSKYKLDSLINRRIILDSVDERFIKPYIFNYNDEYCREKLNKLSEV